MHTPTAEGPTIPSAAATPAWEGRQDRKLKAMSSRVLFQDRTDRTGLRYGYRSLRRCTRYRDVVRVRVGTTDLSASADLSRVLRKRSLQQAARGMENRPGINRRAKRTPVFLLRMGYRVSCVRISAQDLRLRIARIAMSGTVTGNAAIMKAAPSQNAVRFSGDAQIGGFECGEK